MKMQAHRWYDFCYGHRVFGHESKCAHAHGHNGRITWFCEADVLDTVGRVIDFSEIKRLDLWVESNWDHKFLLWEQDPWLEPMQNLDPDVLAVSFNPTSENICLYLLNELGPKLMAGTGVTLTKVEFSETRKCGVTFELGDNV